MCVWVGVRLNEASERRRTQGKKDSEERVKEHKHMIRLTLLGKYWVNSVTKEKWKDMRHMENPLQSRQNNIGISAAETPRRTAN
jgi:hypothetical protein